MSLTPGFAPDALSQWRALGFALQELVLDEIEAIALAPPRAGEPILDIIHRDSVAHHYVFLRMFVDSKANRLSVVGVGYARREISN